MNTIILLNRTQTILMDAYTEYPTGTLPLLDEPAITFLLKRLAQQGITKITLAVSNATIDTVSQFGDGSQYGLELSYLNTDREDDLHWFRDTRKGVLKILDGNVALDATNNDVVKATPLFPEFGTDLDHSIIYLHNVGYALQVIRSGTTRAFTPANPGVQLARYHRQSHQTLRQHYQHFVNSTTLPQHGRGSLIHSSSASCAKHVQGDYVFIGKFCAIHRDCQIRDDVVIGEGSIVDRHVKMSNTVILPNTRIPAHYDLSNCLVSPDWIYNLVDKEFRFFSSSKMTAGGCR